MGEWRLQARTSATVWGEKMPMCNRIAWLFLALTVTGARGADISHPASQHWELQGDLSEACSCQVPCGCNFNAGPSPHHFCWTMFALDIKKGHYGKVHLNGLHLVGAHADKSVAWYIDKSATPEQFAALKAIANHLGYHMNLPAFFEAADIKQEVTDKGNLVEVVGHGGFKANYVMGHDHQKPVVVENTNSWNIPRSMKGKTEYLKYSDDHGNNFDFQKTNSNEGKFDWTDRTPRYF